MSLRDLLDRVEAREKTLTVFNPDDGVTAALNDALADRNVVVTDAWAPGPTNYLVLSEGDTFLTAVPAEDVLGTADETDLSFAEESYHPILDHLDETLFTSFDRSKMLAASREIEDRAWRVGTGELHAGFQQVPNLAEQAEVYRRLASHDSLTVRAYATPDGEVPDTGDVHLHLVDSEELDSAWFVVYDGGGSDANKCALLALERPPAGFYGFWTYDPETVDEILTHLADAYVHPDAGGDGQGHVEPE